MWKSIRKKKRKNWTLQSPSIIWFGRRCTRIFYNKNKNSMCKKTNLFCLFIISIGIPTKLCRSTLLRSVYVEWATLTHYTSVGNSERYIITDGTNAFRYNDKPFKFWTNLNCQGVIWKNIKKFVLNWKTSFN